MRWIPVVLVLCYGITEKECGAQTESPRRITLKFEPATNSLSSEDEPSVAKFGDEVTVQLKRPNFPLTIRKAAFLFTFETERKEPRGGILGLLGAKTTIITKHSQWIEVEETAGNIGTGQPILIKIKVDGEEFTPTNSKLSQKFEQVAMEDGEIMTNGTVAPANIAALYQKAYDKIQPQVAAANGRELNCPNQSTPEIINAGGDDRVLLNPNHNLTAPSQLKFDLEVTIKESK